HKKRTAEELGAKKEAIHSPSPIQNHQSKSLNSKMQLSSLHQSLPIPLPNPSFRRFYASQSSVFFPRSSSSVCLLTPRRVHAAALFSPQFPFLRRKSDDGPGKNNCIGESQELGLPDCMAGDGESVIGGGEQGEAEGSIQRLENQSFWNQVKEIAMFTGPATGLWLCGPLMSLIDTVVIGQGSSIELAALGPGTVLCDYICYVFMFLSVATSNLVATALARQDKSEVQHQISVLLFVALVCGVFMLFFTRFCGSWALTAFAGPKNIDLIPAANSYVQIRGLAWPAVLVGWVAQSASLGMKDSWGPLKALLVSTLVNGVGDIVLCRFLGYGIAGAAWATMVSQVVSAFMMINSLNKKGYNAISISVPTFDDLLRILGIAAPVFITMTSKVAFYSLIIYYATSMGTHVVAANQVMSQVFGMCGVWGEPISQTAQSFMPELIYGAKRDLSKARKLLKSLVVIGAALGFTSAAIGSSIPWFFPRIFTPDPKIVNEIHGVLLPFFIALAVTSINHSLEGTLMAGRDLKFLSFSMTGCFSLGALIVMVSSSKGFGLPGCWFALVVFQWVRYSKDQTHRMKRLSFMFFPLY
ncbi:Protein DETOXIFICATION 46, chloroplastic, partial [Linum grandiflorum]